MRSILGFAHRSQGSIVASAVFDLPQSDFPSEFAPNEQKGALLRGRKFPSRLGGARQSFITANAQQFHQCRANTKPLMAPGPPPIDLSPSSRDANSRWAGRDVAGNGKMWRQLRGSHGEGASPPGRWGARSPHCTWRGTDSPDPRCAQRCRSEMTCRLSRTIGVCSATAIMR